jgi:hypothetical protein
MFYNSANTQFNMIQETVLKTRAGKASFSEVAGMFVWLITVPAIISAMRYGGPGDGKDDGEEAGAFDIAWWGAKALTDYPLSLIPGVRDVSSYYLSDFDYRPSPVVDMIIQPKRAGEEIIKAKEKWEEGEDINWKRLTSEGLMIPGYIFGLPTSQLKITLNAVFDAAGGDYDVKPKDFFMYRKREKKSGKR